MYPKSKENYLCCDLLHFLIFKSVNYTNITPNRLTLVKVDQATVTPQN